MHRAVLHRLCPEYTLWAEQQACSTCSAVGQIKALCAAGQGLFRGAPANKLRRLHYQVFPLLSPLCSAATLQDADDIIAGGSLSQLRAEGAWGGGRRMLKPFEGGRSAAFAVGADRE